eukprot:jgi/Botrbrau1/15289/Bobra.97_1s0014.1
MGFLKSLLAPAGEARAEARGDHSDQGCDCWRQHSLGGSASGAGFGRGPHAHRAYQRQHPRPHPNGGRVTGLAQPPSSILGGPGGPKAASDWYRHPRSLGALVIGPSEALPMCWLWCMTPHAYVVGDSWRQSCPIAQMQGPQPRGWSLALMRSRSRVLWSQRA